MPTTGNVYILMLQTKAVQQAMDQKDFHRAVELRGRSEIHFSAWVDMSSCVLNGDKGMLK